MKKDREMFSIRFIKEERMMLDYVKEHSGKSYSQIIREGIRAIYHLERVKHE